jgi:hypothetical protein
VDLVSASPTKRLARFAANVQRDLATLLGTGATNCREEWKGKIKGGGTAARHIHVCTGGFAARQCRVLAANSCKYLIRRQRPSVIYVGMRRCTLKVIDDNA